MESPVTIVTTPDAIREALRPELRGMLLEILPDAIRRATAKEYLTKAELMKLTGWSSRQVEYKKERRALTFVRRGRTVLFPSEAVFAYLEEAVVPAKHEASCDKKGQGR